MKVILLKNLVIGNQGDIVDLPEPRANYFIRCNAAKEYKQRGRPKGKETETETE